MGKRVSKSVLTALLLQVVTVVCGFVLPRFILKSFGSAYNGIVNSVNQFLSCVVLLRAGIGGVTRAALYKSLEADDKESTGAIVKATELFMRKIAGIFSVLLLVFAAIYPLFVAEQFDWFFSFSLVVILGISVVVQYYFGISNQILLHADQRLYVYNILQIGCTIANTILTIALIQMGSSIHIAKLGSAVAFSISPIAMHIYVRKRYRLDRKAKPDHSAIGQRWDAFAHQLTAFVQNNTALVVLTIFTDLLQVSVYSVYNLVISGINQLIMSCTSAVESFLGSVWAKKDSSRLNRVFASYEWILNTLCCVIFSCTAMLIVPFVMVYTKGVSDVDYRQPLLGGLMCLSAFLSCVRLPYQNLIEAAGHFKQTKVDAWIEAGISMSLSVALVFWLGAVGVVAAVIVALLYRTFRYALYASRHLLNRSYGVFVRRILTSIFTVGTVVGLCFLMGGQRRMAEVDGFAQWVVAAVVVAIMSVIISVAVNTVFYPKIAIDGAKMLIAKVRKRKV